MAYDAEGPDELSVAPAERIIIEGLLVSCFDWFTGRKESTGEVGLVKTSLVKPSTDTCKWVYHQLVSHFNKSNNQRVILQLSSHMNILHFVLISVILPAQPIFFWMEKNRHFSVCKRIKSQRKQSPYWRRHLKMTLVITTNWVRHKGFSSYRITQIPHLHFFCECIEVMGNVWCNLIYAFVGCLSK